MNAQDIGHAAGMVWHHLDQNGSKTVAVLRKEMQLPDQLILMGIGWLAREEKLHFSKERRSLKVALKMQ